jgi:hypothetical protein
MLNVCTQFSSVQFSSVGSFLAYEEWMAAALS